MFLSQNVKSNYFSSAVGSFDFLFPLWVANRNLALRYLLEVIHDREKNNQSF